MHSALISVNMGGQSSQDWDAFLARSKIGKSLEKSVLRLAENVWLVNFQENPAALSRLIGCAENLGLPYGILQFDIAPQWLPVGFDPKTILGQSAGS